MRRVSLFVLALTLAGSSAVPAQTQSETQDQLVITARQAAERGDLDAAIKLLRSGRKSRPDDAALKSALVELLEKKASDLSREARDLRTEAQGLRGVPPEGMRAIITPGAARPVTRTTVAGCGAAAAPVRVGGNIAPPMKTRDVKPIYPSVAQSARVQGVIIVEATIDCEGNVVSPRILRGQPLLNDAALEAVSQWRYTPTLLNGAPVPVIMTMTVTFTLQ